MEPNHTTQMSTVTQYAIRLSWLIDVGIILGITRIGHELDTAEAQAIIRSAAIDGITEDELVGELIRIAPYHIGARS